MGQPPEHFSDYSLEQLADRVDDLVESDYSDRIAVNMALAEVYRRLPLATSRRDTRRLERMREELHRWLRGDDNRRMGGHDGDDWPQHGGYVCMCSIERLEPRTERDPQAPGR